MRAHLCYLPATAAHHCDVRGGCADPGFDVQLPGALTFGQVDGLAVYCRSAKAIMAAVPVPAAPCGKTSKMVGWW